MRKNSIKNTRINGEVQRELSMLISRGEIKDPRINPMTSVVAVEVAPDLKHAKVYISVLGDELTFIMDQSIEYGVNMSKLIDEVNHVSVEEAEEVNNDLQEDADN